MSWCRKSLVWTLLVLWAPITMHCQLEFVGGLESLACCLDTESDGQRDDDCREDGCAAVESGQYRASERQFVQTVPILVAALAHPVTVPGVGAPRGAPEMVRATSPPHLERTWQFNLRAALLPRAPSIAS